MSADDKLFEKVLESGWVSIEGKPYRYTRSESYTPPPWPSPAQEFINQRKQAGDNLVQATCKLLRDSDIRLTSRDRRQISWLIGLLAIRSRRTLLNIEKVMLADLRNTRRAELKEH